MIEDIIKHFKTEFNYIPDDRNKDKQELFIDFLNLANKVNPNIGIEGVKNILSYFNKYLTSFIFVPLTLTEGEFVYTKPNESTNRRNPLVKMNTEGIYYEGAYRKAIISIHSSFTGKEVLIDDLIPYNDRIYLVGGKFLTNIYFDKAYIWKRVIDYKSYTPNAPIPLKLNAVAYNNYYITYIDTLDNKFSSLKQFYDLKFKKDDDEFLINFGCNTNIKLYGINTD